MLAVERRKLIYEALMRDGRVMVTALAEQYGVSGETIRRDLEDLEKEGRAARTYGGAVLPSGITEELPYTLRKRTNVHAKQAIALKIAGLINDGDFIMLDESSTCTFVARAIRDRKNITLITNSIEIILEVSDNESWKILSTGGQLKHGVLALTGHQAENMLRRYHVNTAVISCTGLDLKAGYTDAGEDNALIKRAMMEAADRTILAVDAGKFNQKAFAPIGDLHELSALVTDREPDEQWKTALLDSGVELIY